MGAGNASNSISENGGGGQGDGNSTNAETQVVLNVYDLTPLNQYTIWIGFGIFHSGIEAWYTEDMVFGGDYKRTGGRGGFWGLLVKKKVKSDGERDKNDSSVHGMEFGFGAHDFPVSGVFEVEPKSCPGFIYRCSIPLGHVKMPQSEFRLFIQSIASEYHGDTYHLISKNCNHFTDDVSGRLTGKRIPGWVNRLARLGSLCSCLLPESLQVTTVKQLPEYHACTEGDGTESLSASTPRELTENDDADQDKHLLSPTTGSSDVSFIKEVQR